MAAEPLKSIGYWRGFEGGLEIALPIGIAGFFFWRVKKILEVPSMGRPLTDLELVVLLGALVCVISWAVSRQMYYGGKRKPVSITVLAMAFSFGAVWGLTKTSVSGFETACTDQLEGHLVDLASIWSDQVGRACQIGGVPGNSYVPGTLIRPTWSGQLPASVWLFVGLVSVLASVARRDRRVRPTQIVRKLYKLLEYAPTTGLDGSLGDKPKDGKIQACANSTFWGEICGQVYSAEKEFEPGEWCGRCNQTYTKADFELTFNLVTLFTDNIDLLNSLEKKDTLSWDVPGRIPADGRQSGVERWVVLGQVTVPDVLSVSQLLAIAHQRLGKMTSDNERSQAAIDLAKERASKLYGWIWFGRQTKRLTYARPTNKVLMAVGTTRLRDLVTDSGDELYLQLDIGLLPLELRTAFFKTFMDEKRIPKHQNSKLDMWVPIAPRLSKDLAGLWVPRVEGKALRKWLSTGRLQEEGKRGITIPCPYTVYEDGEEEEEILIQKSIEDIVAEDVAPEKPEVVEMDLTDIFDFGEDTPVELETSPPEPAIAPEIIQEEESIEEIIAPPENEFIPEVHVEPGSLDFVRVPFNRSQTEPDLKATRVGDSISEWEWLEPEQIQLIRQQVLVLIDSKQ